MPDVFQIIDDIDPDKQAMVARRLEDRAQMARFAAIRESYFDAIGLPDSGSIHELGCGTGAVCRAIASRTGFSGTVVGSDLSASLIESAKKLTAKSGLTNIEYFQADGQGSDVHDRRYDLVLAHTVISHVAEPAALLREAIRLAMPGGRIIVHDGDYASLTFDTGTPELDRKMPELYLRAIVANRYVMREMPRLLQQFDVDVTHTIGDVVIETGSGEYFSNMARNYGPIAVSAGTAEQADVDTWMAAIDRAQSEGTFFGSCNFVTYCAAKPG
jgi:ubiquinone/menaquinone biosynthesis C-methylase UbiE